MIAEYIDWRIKKAYRERESIWNEVYKEGGIWEDQNED